MGVNWLKIGGWNQKRTNWMDSCLDVCMYICIYIYMCMYICMYICISHYFWELFFLNILNIVRYNTIFVSVLLYNGALNCQIKCSVLFCSVLYSIFEWVWKSTNLYLNGSKNPCFHIWMGLKIRIFIFERLSGKGGLPMIPVKILALCPPGIFVSTKTCVI